MQTLSVLRALEFLAQLLEQKILARKRWNIARLLKQNRRRAREIAILALQKYLARRRVGRLLEML